MFANPAQRAPNNLSPAHFDYERELVLWRERFRVNQRHAEDAKERWHKAAREAFRMGGED